MKTGYLAERRLNMLSLVPETDGPQKLTEVVKSDIINVLKNYFVFEHEDALIKIDNEEGSITLKLMVKSEGIKPLNYFGSK